MDFKVDIFNEQLTHAEFYPIIESCIKLFLYQRGQMSIPYDLLKSQKQQRTTVAAAAESSKSNLKGQVDEMQQDDNDNKLEENVEPIERIRYMREQRRMMNLVKIREKKLKILADSEDQVLHNCDLILQKVKNIIIGLNARCELKYLKGIMLMFGSSIYNPKERIIFDIQSNLLQLNMNSNFCNPDIIVADPEKVKHINMLLRNFLKSIILSGDYMDFSEKQLRPTVTNVFIITSQELVNSADLELSFQEKMSFSKGTTVNKRTKTFCINMRMKMKAACEQSSSESDTAVDLIDSFIYQISYSFKGVKYKNK